MHLPRLFHGHEQESGEEQHQHGGRCSSSNSSVTSPNSSSGSSSGSGSHSSFGHRFSFGHKRHSCDPAGAQDVTIPSSPPPTGEAAAAGSPPAGAGGEKGGTAQRQASGSPPSPGAPSAPASPSGARASHSFPSSPRSPRQLAPLEVPGVEEAPQDKGDHAHAYSPSMPRIAEGPPEAELLPASDGVRVVQAEAMEGLEGKASRSAEHHIHLLHKQPSEGSKEFPLPQQLKGALSSRPSLNRLRTHVRRTVSADEYDSGGGGKGGGGGGGAEGGGEECCVEELEGGNRGGGRGGRGGGGEGRLQPPRPISLQLSSSFDMDKLDAHPLSSRRLERLYARKDFVWGLDLEEEEFAPMSFRSTPTPRSCSSTPGAAPSAFSPSASDSSASFHGPMLPSSSRSAQSSPVEGSLSRHHWESERVQQEELLKELPDVLAKVSTNGVEEVRWAAEALRELSRGGKVVATQVADKGGLSAVMQLLLCGDAATVEDAVIAALNMAHHPMLRERLLDCGAITSLAGVMQRFGEPPTEHHALNASLLGNVAAALFLLLVSDAPLGILSGARITQPLIRLARQGLYDSGVDGAKDALKLLVKLSFRAETKVELVLQGAVRVLVELVEAQRQELMPESGGLLLSLSKCLEGALAVCSMPLDSGKRDEWEQQLREVVERVSKEGKTKEAASECLRACFKGGVEGKGAGVRSLVVLLSHPSLHAQEFAASGLLRIASRGVPEFSDLVLCHEGLLEAAHTVAMTSSYRAKLKASALEELLLRQARKAAKTMEDTAEVPGAAAGGGGQARGLQEETIKDAMPVLAAVPCAGT